MNIERGWRLVATAISFTLFGLGGLIIRLVIFPLLVLIAQHRARRARLARLLIHYAFKAFVGVMRGFGIFTFEVEGQERLHRQGLLILANHPTLIDVVVLMSLVRNADCVVRAGLRSNPFTRGPVCAADFVGNDDGPEIISDCIVAILKGSNMIIFPEGSRTVPGEPLYFQRGAANVAVRGGIMVTPVIIQCSSTFLPKGKPWYRIPLQRPHFRILVKDDIPVRPFVEAAAEPALAARQLNEYLKNYFSRELTQ